MINLMESKFTNSDDFGSNLFLSVEAKSFKYSKMDLKISLFLVHSMKKCDSENSSNFVLESQPFATLCFVL